MEAASLGRVSTTDALVQSLSERILDGDIPAGAPLREVDLAEHYEVGRWSLRAALQALVYEGLARHVPHRGTFVPAVTRDDVADLFFLRMALESEAVRRLVEERLNVSSVVEAIEQLASMDKRAHWSEVADADLAFHRALIESAGSDRLSRVFASLQLELRLCLAQLGSQKEDPEQVAEQHRGIVAAILSGDADEAVAQIRAHVSLGPRDIGAAIVSDQDAGEE